MATLTAAKDALKNNDAEGAEAECRRLIDSDPGNAEAWHVCGISHARRGDLDEAIACFTKATQFDPESATYPYNLALAYQKNGDSDRAIESYEDALRVREDFMEARANLGNVLVEQGRMLQASACFAEIAKRFPDSGDAHFNLANTLFEIGKGDEAIKHYRTAIELNPNFTAARENLGRAFVDIGEMVEARIVWQSWLDHQPDNEFAKHMLAAAMADASDATDIPTRCSDDCVRQQFNEDFATSFDDQLARLDYRTPELIQSAIDAITPAIADADVLDAGCGTGLCAGGLRPLSRTLVGVDLAPAMLDQARKRDVYDRIVEAELTKYLRDHVDAFDLLVSSDTLCYFGDLTDVLSAAAGSIRENGHLVFSVEDGTIETPCEAGYRLKLHGRYCHREPYIRAVLDQSGFDVLDIVSATQRCEMGKPVKGLIVAAVRRNHHA